MQLAVEVCDEIYFRKIGEIKFPKKHSEMFWQKLPKLFFGKFRKMMIGIGEASWNWKIAMCAF